MTARQKDQDRRSGAAKKRDAERGVQFACHVEVGVGESPDADCVLDYGDPNACTYAGCRREKWTCIYWAPLAARAADPVAAARAEGWRAGAEAMREEAARAALRTPLPEHYANNAAQGHAWLCASSAAADRIRSLDIPEDTANG